MVCDDEEGSDWGVVDELAAEGDKVMCTARRYEVVGHWAAVVNPNVGDWRWGDVGFEAAVSGDQRPNPWYAGVLRVPAAAVERVGI